MQGYQIGKISAAGGANLRRVPIVRDGSLLALLPDGAALVILDPVPITCGGHDWFLVDSAAVGPGFVVTSYVVPSSPPIWSVAGGKIGFSGRGLGDSHC